MKLDKFETTPFHCEMGGDSSPIFFIFLSRSHSRRAPQAQHHKAIFHLQKWFTPSVRITNLCLITCAITIMALQTTRRNAINFLINWYASIWILITNHLNINICARLLPFISVPRFLSAAIALSNPLVTAGWQGAVLTAAAKDFQPHCWHSSSHWDVLELI